MKIFLIVLAGALIFLAAHLWNFGQSAQQLQKMENPLIVIRKKERTLELYDGKRLVVIYKIALGFAPAGDKQREGDGKTPEGEFYIFTKNERSKFYLSLGLSYPNAKDATRGLRDKSISQAEYESILKANREKKMPLQNTKLGGEIYIHGGGRESDWTKGCIALTDEEIKELFEIIKVGTAVRIKV